MVCVYVISDLELIVECARVYTVRISRVIMLHWCKPIQMHRLKRQAFFPDMMALHNGKLMLAIMW